MSIIMENKINKLLIIGFIVLCYSKATGQRYTYADSLINEYKNSVYECYHNPGFWSKNNKPVFTIIKIEIDKNGDIKDIRFSDSADPLFVNAYLKRVKYHDEKQTLKKYASAKSFKNISILIPVSYEPQYNPQHSFESNAIENMLKFNNHDFSGDAIILEPLKIGVLADHNI
jgi:hypothetical protein